MDAITWTNVTIKLSQLQPWEGNPKTSTAKNVKQLQTSRDELGQFQTVAIGPPNGNGLCPVYDGHQRLSSWLIKYGQNSEIAARQSSRPLTDEERRKVAIYSRQIGAWDWDILSGWDASELMERGFDTDLLADWRRDVGALGDFLESQQEEPESKDAEPQTNRADELRQEWGVELGQMWRLPSRTEGQEHRLICGDCTDGAAVARVMGGERAALVSDPPYGINVDTSWLSALNVQRGKPANMSDDKLAGDDGLLDLSWAYKFGEWLVFGFPYIARREAYTGLLVWDKRGDGGENGLGNPVEVAASNTFNGYRLARHIWAGYVREVGEKREPHPTQKPIGVMIDAINLVKNTVIFDPFSGSGTTIIAAENLSRQCRAVEIAPGYVAVALDRYERAFGIKAELIP